MSCNPFEELIACPTELLQPQEAEALAGHLATCPTCQQLKRRLDTELDLFRLAEGPQAPVGSLERFLSVLPSPGTPMEPETLQARLAQATVAAPTVAAPMEVSSSERHAVVPTSRKAPGMHIGARARWLRAGILGTVMMAGLVAFSFSRGFQLESTGDPSEAIRFKGQPMLVIQPALDLQTFTEQQGRTGVTEVQATVDRDALYGDEGLLFTFQVQGGSHLLLIERSPEHVLKVLYQRQDLAADRAAAQQLEIVGETGRLLRYRPSGPLGEYTYLAVLSPQPLASDPGSLDGYWTRYLELQDDALSTPQDGKMRIDAIRVQLVSPSRVRHTME